MPRNRRPDRRERRDARIRVRWTEVPARPPTAVLTPPEGLPGDIVGEALALADDLAGV